MKRQEMENRKKAEEIFNLMTENEKYATRFGLFPAWIKEKYNDSIDLKQICVYLIELATKS